ncbi:PEP-CTERM sorting domain-containing protein [Roseateles sp. LYH14W]|uniref:PEP-CTERM sorting domain-containing protein n=1 Tax=Pelomonas parva TaxID=3299032 RepID=A0ABW7F2C5_9BURK
MISRQLAAAVMAWVMWAQPAQAAEQADVALLSMQSRATLTLGGSPVTRRFDAPFNTSLERDGLGSVTVQSSSSTGGGVNAAAMARSGRAMADFDSTQTFRFADTHSPQWVTFGHVVEGSVQLPSGSGAGSLSYGLTLFAPDGRTLLRDVWSDQTNRASASWFTELGPVSFLAEPGIYRLEVEGVAFADAPVGGGVTRANLSSYLSFTVTPVPEPSMFELLVGGIGVVGAVASRRRAGRQSQGRATRRAAAGRNVKPNDA